MATACNDSNPVQRARPCNQTASSYGFYVRPLNLLEFDRPYRELHRIYHAFGVLGTALREEIGIFHTSSLKVVPKTPIASSVERCAPRRGGRGSAARPCSSRGPST